MCDSDRVEEKGAAAATGDGEWLGGAGRGAGVAMPLDYMPPRTCTSPAPCPGPEPGISTIYGGQTAGRVQAALQISRYLHTAAGARLLLRRGGGGPATQFLAAAVPGLIVEPRAWTPAAGWDHV